MRTPKTTAFWVSRLPHWEVEEGRYFITLHVAGAIPAQGREQIRALADEIRRMPRHDLPDWLQLKRKIFASMEQWLDRAEWNPHLKAAVVAKEIIEAIQHRQHRGDWNVFEYVVMPTHLHLFCEIGRGGLKDTLEDFKRWTGHRAAPLVGGVEARFWQREWFDHWSRSDEEDERIIRYIRNNPVKAGLVTDYLDWPYGSWRS